jgi:uncharacterized membrane protein YbjE (DUF340 family)
VRIITPLVWVLLVSIGYAFGEELVSVSGIRTAVATALAFSAATTGLSWLLIALLLPRSHADRFAHDGTAATHIQLSASRTRPLKECAIALAMVAIGVTLHAYFPLARQTMRLIPSSNTLLYGLIFVVGTELAYLRIARQHWSHHIVTVPLLTVLGSLAGGALTFFALGQSLSLPNALALSSGFGWFTLSGVLIGKHAGQAVGTVALLTDLFRELLAIVLIFASGRRFSRASIGASGATALDSTLPFIKQSCSNEDIPLALISGLALSLAAPVLISFFLSL